MLSILIAFIISNVLTTVWYMLTDEANMVPYRRAEINYGAMMFQHLIYAGLMVYLFPYYYKEARTKLRAFIFGCLIATIMYIPQAVVIRAIWEVDFNSIFVFNTLAHIIIGGIMGLVISIIFDNKQ